MTQPAADLMRALHDEHAPALWSFALHLTGGDREQAQDVVQETMLRAWRRPDMLRKADVDDSMRGWLFTVARNIVIDSWRSRQRRPEFPTATLPERVGTDGADVALQSMLVTDALRRLSPDHRAVLLEGYFRGCTAAQAAVRLGIPVGTVKSRMHYALEALRLTLQEMGMVHQ